MDCSERYERRISYLAHSIRLWCAGSASSREEHHLIIEAVTITRRRLGRRLALCADKLGCDQLEAAKSAVVPLFAPAGVESQLAKSLREKLGADDLSLVRMFEDVVSWNARQFPYRIGMIVNPIRARLDRYLRQLIRTHPRCSYFSACGRIWVAFDSRAGFRWETPPWTFAEILALLDGRTEGEDLSTQGRFTRLVTQITRSSDRSPVTAYSDLIDAFAEFGPSIVPEEMLSQAQNDPLDPMAALAVEQCSTQMEQFSFELTNRYTASGKLSSAEAEAMGSAVADLAREWLNCGFAREHLGLYHYLRLYLPELTELEFEKRLSPIFWRVQFECRGVLLNCLKEKFGARLGK